MDNYLQKGFYAQRASCNVRYNRGFFRTELDEGNFQLDNLEKEIFYCKHEVDFIKRFIEHIKENVIRKCKNLGSVNIMLATFDKNNLMHKIIIVITDLMHNLLQIKKRVNIYKSVFVLIQNEGQIVFTGCLDFGGNRRFSPEGKPRFPLEPLPLGELRSP
jgi:hypothetical protein